MGKAKATPIGRILEVTPRSSSRGRGQNVMLIIASLVLLYNSTSVDAI